MAKKKNGAPWWYFLAKHVLLFFFKFLHPYRIVGRENMPLSGRTLLCSNHVTLGDPIYLGCAIPGRQLHYMAKAELFKNKLFGGLIKKLGAFPIKRGKSDFGALRTAISLVSGGKHIVIFPEGGRSHNNSLKKGKTGAAMVAVKSKAKILPVGIGGKYRIFGKINVNIGKPIDLSGYFDKKISSDELHGITDVLMSELSKLSGIPLKLKN